MKIQDIINSTTHRPWDLPERGWRYYQEWNKAIFLHWKVEPKLLRPFVPKEMEIDLFQGAAWVSLVAFTMEKIRPRYLPPFPPISNFDEINIRTYVKVNGKAGVYFLSMEGGKKWSCKVAKALSGLPYRFSQTNRAKGKYESKNEEFGDQLHIEYQIGAPIGDKSTLDLWLTERYALFQDTSSHINEFEIHHLEWALRQIRVDQLTVDYSRFATLMGGPPDLLHYSEGIRVVAWDRVNLLK